MSKAKGWPKRTVLIVSTLITQSVNAQAWNAFQYRVMGTISDEAKKVCAPEISAWGSRYGFPMKTANGGITANTPLDHPQDTPDSFRQQVTERISGTERSNDHWRSIYGSNDPQVLQGIAQICLLKSALSQLSGQSTSTSRAQTTSPHIMPQNQTYPPDLPPVPLGTEAERKAVFTADDLKHVTDADLGHCMFGAAANRRLTEEAGGHYLETDAQVIRNRLESLIGKSREQIQADIDENNQSRAVVASNDEALIERTWPGHGPGQGMPFRERKNWMEMWRGETCYNQLAMKIADRHAVPPQPAPHESFAITPGWASTLRMTSREYNLRESALAQKAVKLHNAANDATECLLILPTATKVEWGTDGKYKMVNTCSGRVAASWCSNAEECNAGHGNLWTLRPGQEWPIFFADPANPYIRLGGCKVDGAVPLPSDAAISRQGGVNTRHNDPPTAVGVQKLPGHICE